MTHASDSPALLESDDTSSAPIYRQAHVPAEKRVEDLLGRMTLEEKAAQMMCVWQRKAETLVDARGNFDLAKAKDAFKEGHGIGQVGRPSDAGSTPTTPERGRGP